MLSAEQTALIKAEAAKRRLPEKSLLQAAERIVSASDGTVAKTANSDTPKIFQYHLPFLRVHEIRAFIGLTERIANDDMLCGEFMARFGGALAASSDSPKDGAVD